MLPRDSANPNQSNDDVPPVVLGATATLAESAWLGTVPASDALDPPPGAPSRRRVAIPRLSRLRLTGLLTREFTIAEASGILIVSFFLSAVLGAVRQVLLNATFGTGREANAYYAAARLPDTLFSLIAGGALSSAMIPVLLSTWRAQGEAAGRRLTNLVLTTLLATVGIVVITGEIFAPAFVTNVLAPGFDAETSRLTVTLTRIMLLEPLILAVGTVAIAVLNSRNQFLLPGLSIVSQNFTVIAGILAARAYPQLGIYGPTLGAVSGAALQVLILLPGLIGQRFRYRPAWEPRDARLREVIRLLIPNGLSVGVGYAGFILDTAFASQAREPAGLPALYNAWLLAALPVTLLGHAVAQSAFPRLAAHVVAAAWPVMRRTLLRTLAASTALSVPIAAGLIVLGRPLIHILFEHGKFDAAAGSLTYALLVPYVIALPAYIATEVVTRGLIALRDTRTPLLTNTAQLAGRAALILWLLDRTGVVAIPIAFAVTASLETLVLGTVLLIKIRRGSDSNRRYP